MHHPFDKNKDPDLKPECTCRYPIEKVEHIKITTYSFEAKIYIHYLFE